MAWEFILAGMYLLGVLTWFVMTLTMSQDSRAKPEEVKRQTTPEKKTMDEKKAA